MPIDHFYVSFEEIAISSSAYLCNIVVLVSATAIQQQESAINLYAAPPSWVSLPSSHPFSPGHHRTPDWAPCATQQLITSSFLIEFFFVGLFDIELYEMFVYFGNVSLVYWIICRCALLFYTLSFHFVYGLLCCAKAFKFDLVPFEINTILRACFV